jgi:hypothetical protein
VRPSTILHSARKAWKSTNICGFTILSSDVHSDLNLFSRKARASVLAIDERQKLETLTRDEKTANRALTQLSEKQQGLEEKINTRRDDLAAQNAKKLEVSHLRNQARTCFWRLFCIVGRENLIIPSRLGAE